MSSWIMAATPSPVGAMLCTGTEGLAGVFLQIGLPIQVLEHRSRFKLKAPFVVSGEQEHAFLQDSMGEKGRRIVENDYVDAVSFEQVRQLA
jgi:hypothetical protein